jgi:hypothetical protein
MPAATSMNLGQGFVIYNTSGTTVTVNTSAAAAIATVPTGMAARFWVNNSSANNPGNWTYGYTEFTGVTGTGSAVLSAAPTITGSAIIGGTTFPSATGTTGQVLTLSSAGTAAWSTPSGGSAPEVAIVTATAYYAYTTNDQRLNWSTEVRDPGNWLTLGTSTAAGQLTITTAGTYLFELSGMATVNDGGAGTQFRNVTGSTNLQTSSLPSISTSYMWPHYAYVHTITANNVYEFRHTGTASTLNAGSKMILKITKL